MINIQQNIPLAPYTTFKIGGPARFFCKVKSEDELMEALNYARNNRLEFFILGGGSNILVSDNGFNGLVIKLLITSCKLQSANLECDAGLNLAEAVKLAAENSLAGLEWAAGIPGTVGGAVRGNAGAFGSCMADNVVKVKIIDVNPELSSRKFQELSSEQLKFDYRSSIFKENNNFILTSAVLKLKKGNKDEIESKIKENIEKRVRKQTQGLSAGSFFKNPVVKDEKIRKRFEADTGLKCKDDKIPAGWIVEEIGFLGKKVGNMQVSEKHGNFVINLGGGKAEDAVILASLIKQKVREKFHTQLIEEIQFVGF